MPITRRQFVKRSSLAAAMGFPMVCSSRVLGANDQILVGLVGTGGRGTGSHLPGFEQQDGVTVVAVCDADHDRMARAAGILKSRYGHEAAQYPDMRKMFERKDIDAIGNATQVYWHALSTIWACQAGKHVYVEKPLSHYIWEGRQMVNAARKHARIVQCGTQHRASRAVRDAIGWTREGHLGKIRHVTCFAIKPRTPIGKRSEPLEIPPSVDYELWCGPAKKLPIFRNRLQYDCRYDWNTGDGETVDQGVHELDVARWWLGENALPRRTMSIGGRFLWDDAGQATNAHIMVYDFPTAPVMHEIYNVQAPDFVTGLRFFKTPGTPEEALLRRGPYGLIVACEGGSILVQAYQSDRTCVAYDRDGKIVRTFSGHGPVSHFVNFIEAVRSGRREDLNADVEQGSLSTATPHTSNISYRVGEVASVTRQRAQIDGVPGFDESFDRFQTTLGHHGIDPNTATLGPWLQIDRRKERIKNHDRANELVRGSYRELFQVPDLSI